MVSVAPYESLGQSLRALFWGSRIVALMSERHEVIGHYEGIREEDRISSGLGQLELLRVQEVLLRHLPAPPARVLDVGGGTGIHASWLAERGDIVHVIDLTPRHVERVRSELGGLGVTAEEGDARTLNVPENSFDVVLVFGPMYHLTTIEDRQLALREAVRAGRPGGLIAVGAINRFASLFDGLARGFLFDADFRKIVERDLAEGQHRNPDNRPHWFTTAYLHEPEQLRGELEGVGLDVVELVGLEGLAAWLNNLGEQWETDDGRESILFAARTIESTPSLLGLSAHLLAIARAPR
jgi:ubiquinone/menaquinone biosynthesis C-methylase UbiE